MSICLLILSLAATGVYAVVVQQDLVFRKIPNMLALAIVVIGALKWAIMTDITGALWALTSAALVFVVTAVLFWRGWMGGGDVKLMTATSFLVGAGDTYAFIVYTAVVGGAVAIVVVIASMMRRVTVDARPQEIGSAAGIARPKPTVPYGVAIACAGVLVLFQQYLSR